MQIQQLTSGQDSRFEEAVQVLVEAFKADEAIRALTGWTDAGLEASYRSSLTSSVLDNEVWLAMEEEEQQNGQTLAPATVLGVMTVKPPSREDKASQKSKTPKPHEEAYLALLKPEHKKHNAEVLDPLMDKMYTEAYAPEGRDSTYYIALLGVRPAAQGRGIGSALVRHLMARASAQGVSTAVSTHNEKNANYYQKLGFQILKTGLFDAYGYDQRIPFWCFKSTTS